MLIDAVANWNDQDALRLNDLIMPMLHQKGWRCLTAQDVVANIHEAINYHGQGVALVGGDWRKAEQELRDHIEDVIRNFKL